MSAECFMDDVGKCRELYGEPPVGYEYYCGFFKCRTRPIGTNNGNGNSNGEVDPILVVVGLAILIGLVLHYSFKKGGK